jgi:hypothetical protein
MKSNTLNLTLKFISLEALIELTNKLPIHKNISHEVNSPLCLPYILSQGIVDCIRTIKPDLQERKVINYTKGLSLGLGIITSGLVSCSYNGIDYILNFSLTLLKTSATTLIIDKLNKLKTIDGVSIAILINFIMTIPKMILGLSTQPLTTTLLFLAHIGATAITNYKLLQSTEDIDIHYKDKTDKFNINTRNSLTMSIIISNFITSLIPSNPPIQGGLQILLCPLVQWFMANNSIDKDQLNTYLKHNNIYLGGQKNARPIISKMIRNNSIKLGLIGALTTFITTMLIQAFGISISPIMITITINSLINISFSTKVLIKRYNHSKLIRDGKCVNS